MRKPQGSRRELIIVVGQDRFFLSHFLDRALAARQAGFGVTVACPEGGLAGRIEKAGLGWQPIELDRHSINPLKEMSTIRQLRRLYVAYRPDLIWHIGLKPIVLGTLAAGLAGRSGSIVNAPVGMGFVFAGESARAKLLRPLLRIALRRLLDPPGARVVFENEDDLKELVSAKMVRPRDAVLIRGAGVDLDRFKARPEPAGVPVVLFAARLIREKGVGEFVQAARLLRERGVNARFLIAGGVDRESSSAISESELREWEAAGIVEWLGLHEQMPELLAGCNLFCLPTWYREGLPKVVLEAMACQRAVITTDMPGCREAVHHMGNGILVPPRDVMALAGAIERLLQDSALRKKLAEHGRQRAEAEFSSQAVCEQTLVLFRELTATAGTRLWHTR